MEKNFCFDEKQVDRLVQLVKHSLINLDIMLECPSFSDNAKLSLKDEHSLLDSILDVLLNRG